MESWIKDCRYILMSPRHPNPGFEAEYEMAYDVWKRAWGKYREEMGVPGPLKSDGFFLADEMGVLFFQGKCVGFASFTYGDLETGPMPDLGWFGSWDEVTFAKLKAISRQAIMCTQFTVNPDFAGKGHIVRWKDIISLYTLLRFDHSPAGVMAGCLNTIRGMQNASGEDAGAVVLKDDHTFNYGGLDLPAQLVAYQKENVQKMIQRKELTSLCEELWQRLEHVSEFEVLNNVIEFKQAA